MTSSTHVDRASSQLRGPWTMACVPIGTATSNDRPGDGPRNDGGVTPMMVNGTRSRRERSANDAGFAAEAALPERVADDSDGAIRPAVALVVGGAEGAAENRRNPQHSKNPPLAQTPSANSVAPPRDRSKRVSDQAMAPSAHSRCRSRSCSQIGLVHDHRPAARAARARGPAGTSAGRRRRARRSRCWRRCRARARPRRRA